MAARRMPAIRVDDDRIIFNGGYDAITPPLELPSGFARDAQNFEQDTNGGYTRIAGYERYDGRTRPSDASYALLPMSTMGSYPTDGSTTITGATSGATAVVVGQGTNYWVVTKVTGTFTPAGEALTAGGGHTSAGTATNGASTPQLHAQYTAAAANVYRALIQTVPGTGKILGVWVYNDVVYAFRNNAGGTAVDMYKATAGGWVKVALGREIKFDTGTGLITDGMTVVGGTSAASAVVARVELESGAWGTNAAGHLIFASVTGAFVNGEALKVGGTTQATARSADTAITFAVPSGRFEFSNYNFGGSANTTKMYGVDGKNRGFEFDGTTFVPINTGMTNDAPEHLATHKGRLFYSFKGSVQFCVAGFPYQWSVVVGAGELAMGDSVTGFMSQPGGADAVTAALAVFTQRNMAVLYGTSTASFQLQPFDQKAGAYAYTMQYVGLTLLLNDRGINSLQTTQKFGNFASATLSKRVQPWLKARRSNVTASSVARDKNQYRLFFGDGSALFATHDNGTITGSMPILFPDPVRCVVSEQTSDGNEVAYFGSDAGYVYQMEKGTSFDGVAIEFLLDLAYANQNLPRWEKAFRDLTFEVTGTGYFEFNASYQLGYASTLIEQPGDTLLVNALSPTNWDSFTWDAFTWDGVNLLPSHMTVNGTAENISMRIHGISDYMEPARISGATIGYTRRRRLR
jgi:hypothetical protein